MTPILRSSSTAKPSPAASSVTIEIETVRNCVGRVYKFKPYNKWSSDTQYTVDKDVLYQQHPVVIIHRQSDGQVHIVTITSTIDKTIDPRMYMPVSGNHWDTADHRAKVNLASTETDACEMPKPQSCVRLDSRRQVPFEVLQEFHSHGGEQYQLSSESAIKLWDSVMEAERGFVSQQEWEYQNAEEKVSLAVSSYINRWTSVEQGEKQIRMLRLLQQNIKALAGVVDECLDHHWLQPQQELERSLSEEEHSLQNAVRTQLGYHSHNKTDNNPILKAVEAEAVRRVDTEIKISEMRGQNSKTGQRTAAQNKKLEQAVKVLIKREIQRGQGGDEDMGSEVATNGEKAAKLSKKKRKKRKAPKARNQSIVPDFTPDWEAAESTLTESGYSDKDLAILECGRLAQAE